MGQEALQNNATGGSNTATGRGALFSNTTADNNTAAGAFALFNNTTGTVNTAIGSSALIANTTGNGNIAVGGGLSSNTTGNDNTAMGFGAGVTATASNANVTGSNNTFVGFNSGPGTAAQLTNATAVGENALVSASNALVLGGTGPDAVNVGIGTQTPQSTLQVAGASGGGYGNYLQIPIVSSTLAPPASACNATTFAGRMVLQDNTGLVKLWACSVATGKWVVAK